jgi:hypothetical protein
MESTTTQDKAEPCVECGETGRMKARIYRGDEKIVLCHDEERSCFNFARLTGYDQYFNIKKGR